MLMMMLMILVNELSVGIIEAVVDKIAAVNILCAIINQQLMEMVVL